MTFRTSVPLRPLAILLLLVAGFLVTPQVVAPARACANAHADFWLEGFDGVPQAPPFYMSAENETPMQAVIGGMIHDCGSGDPAIVDWETTNGSASAGSDYAHADGPSGNLNDNCGGDCPTGKNVPVGILNNNSEPEAVAEHLNFNLSTPDGRVIGPDTVPVFIVDDDGSSRVAFAQAPSMLYRGQEYTTSPRIPVFRAGNASQTMNVNFSLAGGGADPAEPSDFDPDSGTITFNPTERLKYIILTIVNDSLPENDETITASLSGVAGTATYTILDEDLDNAPPISRFHHPRDGLTYNYRDLRILVAHTYGKDEGGSRMVDADMALRRLKVNGTCQWWDGNSWVPRGCAQKLWFAMRPDPDTPDEQPYWHQFKPPLAPSIGTKVRNYRAWTRGHDGAGNLENSFKAGRNLSTFEVRQS
jgi:Calx-beta domain